MLIRNRKARDHIRGFDRNVIIKPFILSGYTFKCLYKTPSAHYCSAPALNIPQINRTESSNLAQAKGDGFFYYSG
jgi:hypothetical protein